MLEKLQKQLVVLSVNIIINIMKNVPFLSSYKTRVYDRVQKEIITKKKNNNNKATNTFIAENDLKNFGLHYSLPFYFASTTQFHP